MRSLALLLCACAALSLARDVVDDVLSSSPSEKKLRPYHDGKALHVPLGETDSLDLLDHWISQAMSGLMAAVAGNKLDTVDEEAKEELTLCSKNAHTVPDHARCVKKLLKTSRESGERIVKDTAVSHLKYKTVKGGKEETKEDDDVEWTGGFGQARAKRSSGYKVVHRDNYALRTRDEETPFAQVAHFLTKTVRAIKNKNDTETWRETLVKVRKTAEEEKAAKKKREHLKKKLKHMIDNTPEDFADPRRPLAMKKMEMEDDQLETAQKMVKEGKDEIRIPLNLMREAIKMGMMLAGKNISDFETKTLKLVSPRFMSVVEETEADDETINLLSPSLFSLHEDGKGIEALTSLPSILKKLNNEDQAAWMDFIIESSGVSDAVSIAAQKTREAKNKDMLGSNGEPLYFTKKNITNPVELSKVEAFESLDKTYSEEQRKELDKKGYVFMTADQIEILYGEKSPFHNKKTYDNLMNMTNTIAADDHDAKHELIEKDIHALSEMDKFNLRAKDFIGTPFVFSPLTFASVPLSNTWIVLSPLVFSPITLSPAVLGPIILSPWVFIPLVLSPRVLSPLIVNPLIFSPIILSPLVLHPLILVPGIFNPFILSPLVLSPFILSPQVFTPLILSPFALNPLILTPMVGSPLILSPFVLSPIILSPQVLFAVVLSPYALSPLVESKLTASEVVLSPSWLS